jgi:hypothetical protein
MFLVRVLLQQVVILGLTNHASQILQGKCLVLLVMFLLVLAVQVFGLIQTLQQYVQVLAVAEAVAVLCVVLVKTIPKDTLVMVEHLEVAVLPLAEVLALLQVQAELLAVEAGALQVKMALEKVVLVSAAMV